MQKEMLHLIDTAEDIRAEVARLLSEKDRIRDGLACVLVSKRELKYDLAASRVVEEMAHRISSHLQEQIRITISGLVSYAIKEIFGEEYSATIKFELKRGKTEAYVLVRKGRLELDPKECCGCGLLDIASLFSRISQWHLGRKGRPFFLLDEPLKHLSKDRHERASLVISKVCESLGIQMLVISHDSALCTYAGKHQQIESVSEEQPPIHRRAK